MYCAICKHTIDLVKGFTNPGSHEPDCPIFVDGEKVAEVIADAEKT